MDGGGMFAPHCNRHAADLAGKRTPPRQSAAMQCLDSGTFIHTKFPQALRLSGGECVPFNMVDIGRATSGQKIKTQYRTSYFANDYHYPEFKSSHFNQMPCQFPLYRRSGDNLLAFSCQPPYAQAMTDASNKSRLHKHLPDGLGLKEFVTLMSALIAMSALSIDTMLPAMPDIARDLSIIHDNDRQSIISVFFLGLAGGALIYGPLSDHHGRKPVLLCALGMLLAATLLCTFAWSFPVLLIGRFLAGFCAASCRVVVLSVVRDCYKGDMMARIMSLIMFIFMVVPMVAPSLGSAVLLVADWRWIFGLLAFLVGAVTLWIALRLPETLDPAHHIRVHPRELMDTFLRITGNRSSIGYMLASGVMMSGLVGFIVSVQQIFFDVFHRPDLLPMGFAMISAWMAAGNLLNGRLVRRFGARRMSQTAVIGVMLLSIIHYLLTRAGWETIWLFILIQGMTTLCFSFAGVNFSSIAMEPFARGAGFASSLQAALTTLISALLGGMIGAAFDGTTIPIAIGFLAFGAMTLAVILWAERGKLFTRPGHAHLREVPSTPPR